MNRRKFLVRSAAAGASLTGLIPSISLAGDKVLKSDRIVVATVGLRGRGHALTKIFANADDVDLRYMCDVDENILKERTAEIVETTRHRPEALGDFRRALDDPSVDAIAIATPDHWHAIPTILACQAGKDAYTEKPDGHNILEGKTMVAMAKKHKRIVQLGTHVRSSHNMLDAMAYIRAGNLGRTLFAKAWESQRQGNLGNPPDSKPPQGVDYDFWLGPAPKRPFNHLRFHGNWRWFLDYGTGDLGNDGVHRMDYALWGLRTAVEAQGEKLPRFPKVVSSHGGKNYFDDAQEWPDTLMTTYDFGGYLLTYEMRLWSPYPLHGLGEGAIILGDKGSVLLGNRGWSAYDEEGKEILTREGPSNLQASFVHVRNFLDCMRTRKRPAADLETVGHPSSLLCHVGNVAWRVGRSVKFDAKTETFLGDPEANQFVGRPEYRKPWVLPKI
jgi:predicted dehydrogenase